MQDLKAHTSNGERNHIANSTFEQALFQQTIRHREQPSLSQVVTNCEKEILGQVEDLGTGHRLKNTILH